MFPQTYAGPLSGVRFPFLGLFGGDVMNTSEGDEQLVLDASTNQQSPDEAPQNRAKRLIRQACPFCSLGRLLQQT